MTPSPLVQCMYIVSTLQKRDNEMPAVSKAVAQRLDDLAFVCTDTLRLFMEYTKAREELPPEVEARIEQLQALAYSVVDPKTRTAMEQAADLQEQGG